MMDRIFYTIDAINVIAAAVLLAIVAYQWLKEQQRPVDNVYPLHRRGIL